MMRSWIPPGSSSSASIWLSNDKNCRGSSLAPIVTPVRCNVLPTATCCHFSASSRGMPEAARRNPDWEWDETVLACDLVFQNDWQPLPPEDQRVVELSRILR